jgi:hypothetical protein
MIISAKDFKNRLLAGEHLPEGLVVEGHLNLQGCAGLTYLPRGLVVTNTLDLRKCTSLTHLPPDLKVGGDLNLFFCTSLVGIPPSIEIGDQIWCEWSLVRTIPYEDLPLYLSIPFGENRVRDYINHKLLY